MHENPPSKRDPTGAVLAVLFGAAALILQPSTSDTTLVKLVPFYVAGVLAAALVAVRTARRSLDAPGLPLLAFALLPAAYLLVRTASGPPSDRGPVYCFSVLSGTLVMLALATPGDRARRGEALHLLAAGMAVALAVPLMQALGLDLSSLYGPTADGGRLSGSTGNPTLLGSLGASGAVMGAGFALRRGSMNRIAGLLLSAEGVASVVLSGTRAGLLGMLAGSILLVCLAPLRRRSRLAAAALLIAAVAAASVAMWPRLREAADPGSGSVAVRRLLWSGACGMFEARPFLGWGTGSFQRVFPSFRDPDYAVLFMSHSSNMAHSEYLQTLAEGGLAAAVSWVALACCGIVMLARRGRSMEALVPLAGAVSVLAESAVSISLRLPLQQFQLAVLAGLSLAGARSGRTAPRAAALLPIAGAAALLAGGFGAAFTAMRSGSLLHSGGIVAYAEAEAGLAAADRAGDPSVRQSLLGLSLTDCRTAESDCRRCVEINPEELAGWYALGNSSLLEADILSESGADPAAVTAALRSALAAYDSLSKRAPDFAELQYNYAFLCYRLGLLPGFFEHLARTYTTLPHRIADLGAVFLFLEPLCSDISGLEARQIALLDRAFSVGTDGIGPERALPAATAQILEADALTASLLAVRDPELATAAAWRLTAPLLRLGVPSWLAAWRGRVIESALAQEGEALAGRAAAGDPGLDPEPILDLLERTGLPLPYHRFAAAATLLDRGDKAGLPLMSELNAGLVNAGRQSPACWPGGGSSLPRAALAALADPSGPDLDSYFAAVDELILADFLVSSSLTLAQRQFPGSVDSGLLSSLDSLDARLGGALRAAGGPVPGLWTDPGYTRDVVLGIRSLSASLGPDDPTAAVLGFRIHFRFLWSLLEAGYGEDSPAVSLALAGCDSCIASAAGTAGEAEALGLCREGVEEEQGFALMNQFDSSPAADLLERHLSAGQAPGAGI